MTVSNDSLKAHSLFYGGIEMAKTAIRILMIFCLPVWIFSFPVKGNTIIVDQSGGGDFQTIQEGINAAFDGDTVLVMPGTYTGANNRDLSFQGKSIIVTSAQGPEVTIIYCEAYFHDQHNGFMFNNGETRDAVLAGFTIWKGFTERGGAIYCHDSSPTIMNNILRNNYARNGGGISIRGQSAPLVSGNEIKNNLGPRGGGIYVESDLPGIVISENIIEHNWSYYTFGSGILIKNALNLRIRNNVIRNNRSGGGLAITGGSEIRVRGNQITDNEGSAVGGILITHTSPTLINNLIKGNYVVGRGFGGGVLCCLGGGGYFFNNTIQDNASRYGGGISFYQFQMETLGNIDLGVEIHNCIIRNNSAVHSGQQIYVADGYDVTISYSDIEGGLDDIHNEGVVNWLDGNLDMDPLFVTGPDGDCYLSQIVAGQTVDSPCVDNGSPDAILFRGTTRTDEIQDAYVLDMGYHYPATILY